MNGRDAKGFFFSTIRGRLILSVAAVNAILMTLFVADLTSRQRAILLYQQEQEAITLARTLSTSAAVWIVSDDIAGLQELIESQLPYPELIFAILTDESGRVLAHTDSSRKGQFLLDLPKEIRFTIIGKSESLTDVAVPSMLGGRFVGWARVGIGQGPVRKKFARMAAGGALYAMAAIAIGSVLAWLLGIRITRRLYMVQDTINRVRKGEGTARAAIAGTDEAASIAVEFNALLDAIDQRSAAIVAIENRYRLLIHNIRVAVIVHGGDTRILMTNPMAQELLGLSEEQLTGKEAIDPAWSFLREDGSKMAIEEYPVNKVLETRRKVEDLVIGIRRLDRDDIVWALSNAEPTMNEGGGVEEIIVSFVDITYRKQVEESLKKSENLYSSVIAASPDGVGVVDERGKVLFASRRIYDLLGLGQENGILELNALNWLIPEERDRAASDLGRIAQGSILFGSQYKLVRNDGSKIPVEISGAPIRDEAGRLSGIVTIVRDATIRRQAEKELHDSRIALLNRETELNEAQRLAHIGSWEWDADNDTIRWSNEYYRIYGIDPDMPTPNYTEHLKAYTAESAGRLNIVVKQAMEIGESYEVDLELANPTATTKWIVARGEAKRDMKNKICGLRGTVQNITERKKTEDHIRALNEKLEKRVAERTADIEKKSQELKENQTALMNLVEDLNEKTLELELANAKLQELDSLKSMFIASMSHELRTPLNSIIGFSSILLNEWVGPVNAEQKDNLASVLRSGKHLLSLINDVIDVSKIEAGMIESVAEDFDIRELVDEAVETIKKDIEMKALDLRVNVPRRIMHMDRRRLLQSLLNLLSNAGKYTNKGSIDVIAEISADGSWIDIAVADTGFGITETDLDRLFLPFVRLDAAHEGSIPGTGLGLYLTKKLVHDILKGEILVSSTFGTGSRFTIRIPVVITGGSNERGFSH
ncbi:MAG TPA: hypothetical protein DIC34_05175 [Treponema sp.]|nr:MAG: hypothetical protein A2001_14755 [Treponema sp. GWC1_61_84]OHE68869.1 MAG: hypothetical protein A2413_07595 [Treponema sp. RIFOXYC1_FULL_61_9]HCM25930.1 hypothetical protein [Treponema sp.]